MLPPLHFWYNVHTDTEAFSFLRGYIKIFFLKRVTGSNRFERHIYNICEEKRMQLNSGVEDPANCSCPRGSQRERCFHTPGELYKSIQICTLWLMWSIRSGHRWLFQSVGKTHAHLEWKGSQENCMAVQKVKCSPRNWAWHRLHEIDDKMHHRLHSDRQALGVPLRDMGSWLTKGNRKCVVCS